MQQQRYRKQDQESARTSHGFHGDWSKSPKFTSWGSSAQAEAATKHRRKGAFLPQANLALGVDHAACANH